VQASTQYVFLYDVSGPNQRSPRLSQVLKPVNAHVGLVFSPDGQKLYAAGGRDDVVRAYAKTGSSWAEAGTIALNHNNIGIGVRVSPNAVEHSRALNRTKIAMRTNCCIILLSSCASA